MKIGVLSDTHGLLRTAAVRALGGVQHILHAGDVGDPEILARLASIAPLTAIRGNIDVSGACAALPEEVLVELGGKRFYMVHNIADISAASSQADAIVFGHSHRPSIEWRDRRLYLNPGSAGPRRFRLPITVAIVAVDKELSAKIVELSS